MVSVSSSQWTIEGPTLPPLLLLNNGKRYFVSETLPDGVVTSPVYGPGLLFLAVGDGRDGVALDADGQSVPLGVG